MPDDRRSWACGSRGSRWPGTGVFASAGVGQLRACGPGGRALVRGQLGACARPRGARGPAAARPPRRRRGVNRLASETAIENTKAANPKGMSPRPHDPAEVERGVVAGSRRSAAATPTAMVRALGMPARARARDDHRQRVRREDAARRTPTAVSRRRFSHSPGDGTADRRPGEVQALVHAQRAGGWAGRGTGTGTRRRAARAGRAARARPPSARRSRRTTSVFPLACGGTCRRRRPRPAAPNHRYSRSSGRRR